MSVCQREILARVGFPNGIKPSHSATTVPQGSVWFARNVRGRDMGILKTRPGTLTATPIDSQARVRSLNVLGTSDVLMTLGNNTYLANMGVGWTNIESSWVTPGMSNRFAAVSWQLNSEPVLYFFTGDGLYRADDVSVTLCAPYVPGTGEPSNLLGKAGTPAELDPEAPMCKSTVAAMKFGMSMRAACAYQNRVYLSAPSSLTYWPVNQVIYLPDDGGDVVALAVWFDILVIFRRNDVWAFIGDDVASTEARLVRQAQIGCVARDSVVDVPGVGLCFLGSDNVYAMTGVQAISDRVQVTPLGNDVQPLLRMALANDGATDACAVYHDSEYILSMSNFGGGDKLFVYQTSPAVGWFVDSGPNVTYWLQRNGSLYSMRGQPAGLQHHSYDYSTDNGQAISVEIHFGQEMLPVYSKIRRLFVLLQGQDTIQNVKVSVTTDGLTLDVREFSIAAPFGRDFAIGEGSIELDRIGRVTEMRTYEARVSMKGQYVQVVITGSGTGERLGIAGFLVEYIARSRARGQRSGVVKTWPT